MMTGNKDVETQLISIEEILQNEFLIPKYQRGYRWTKREVLNLLEDVDRACHDSDKYYFLDSVTLIERVDDERFEVIDGQQRLYTIFLISQIAQGLVEKKIIQNNEIFSQLDTDTISNIVSIHNTLSIGAGADRIKFERRREQGASSSVSTAGNVAYHYHMSEARRIIKTFLNKKVKSLDDMQAYMDFFLKKVLLISTKTHDEKIAYKIFEALNFRNKPLTTIDLIRVYIFRSIHKDNFQACFEMWENLEDTIKNGIDYTDGTDGNAEKIAERIGKELDGDVAGLFITFFECYTGNAIEDNRLFHNVEKSFEKEVDANKSSSNRQETYLKFFSRIVFAAGDSIENFPNYYLAARNPNNPLWSKLKIEKFVRNTLCGRKIFRAPIAAMFYALNMEQPRITTNQAEEVISDLYSLIARTELLGRIPMTAYNSILSKFSHKLIFDEKKPDFEKIIKDLFKWGEGGILLEVQDLLPDDRFIGALANNLKIKNENAKWLLHDIEFALHDHSALLGKKNHAEHILPQKAGVGWEHFTKEDKLYHKNRIGNFALLIDTENRAKGNKPFADKLDAYADSNFTTTNELTEKTEWTKEDIDERGVKLATAIASVWNFHYYTPPSSKSNNA